MSDRLCYGRNRLKLSSQRSSLSKMLRSQWTVRFPTSQRREWMTLLVGIFRPDRRYDLFVWVDLCLCTANLTIIGFEIDFRINHEIPRVQTQQQYVRAIAFGKLILIKFILVMYLVRMLNKPLPVDWDSWIHTLQNRLSVINKVHADRRRHSFNAWAPSFCSHPSICTS